MKKIKTVLLVTFDFTQRGKSGTGLAAASLISACREHKSYGVEFTIQHLAITMSTIKSKQLSALEIVGLISKSVELVELDRLVLACYVWSSALIEPVIKLCKMRGFVGKTILGGYQIHKDSCHALYPSGDYYLPGYAEAALPEAILDDKAITSRVINIEVNMEKLPSPYLDGTFVLEDGHEMIHWETRRGCIFKCNFCAHRDLKSEGVHLLGMDKIKKELLLFKEKNVKKINVLDPIFNREPNHLIILQYAIEIGLTSLLSFQVRFEFITEAFLELCSKLNVHLEFGLQTANETESIMIKRKNNMNKVTDVIELLHQWQQAFEVSLIYGLPGQTVASFKESINYLKQRHVLIIKAFPLMLLEGTQLAKDKDEFQITEDFIDESGIPHVVSCHSFTRSEWNEMHSYASQLTESKEAA